MTCCACRFSAARRFQWSTISTPHQHSQPMERALYSSDRTRRPAALPNSPQRTWMASDEKRLCTAQGVNYFSPVQSPDGKRLAIIEPLKDEPIMAIAMLDLSTCSESQFFRFALTSGLEPRQVRWMPNGRGLVIVLPVDLRKSISARLSDLSRTRIPQDHERPQRLSADLPVRRRQKPLGDAKSGG